LEIKGDFMKNYNIFFLIIITIFCIITTVSASMAPAILKPHTEAQREYLLSYVKYGLDTFKLSEAPKDQPNSAVSSLRFFFEDTQRKIQSSTIDANELSTLFWWFNVAQLKIKTLNKKLTPELGEFGLDDREENQVLAVALNDLTKQSVDSLNNEFINTVLFNALPEKAKVKSPGGLFSRWFQDPKEKALQLFGYDFHSQNAYLVKYCANIVNNSLNLSASQQKLEAYILLACLKFQKSLALEKKDTDMLEFLIKLTNSILEKNKNLKNLKKDYSTYLASWFNKTYQSLKNLTPPTHIHQHQTVIAGFNTETFHTEDVKIKVSKNHQTALYYIPVETLQNVWFLFNAASLKVFIFSSQLTTSEIAITLLSILNSLVSTEIESEKQSELNYSNKEVCRLVFKNLPERLSPSKFQKIISWAWTKQKDADSSEKLLDLANLAQHEFYAENAYYVNNYFEIINVTQKLQPIETNPNQIFELKIKLVNLFYCLAIQQRSAGNDLNKMIFELLTKGWQKKAEISETKSMEKPSQPKETYTEPKKTEQKKAIQQYTTASPREEEHSPEKEYIPVQTTQAFRYISPERIKEKEERRKKKQVEMDLEKKLEEKEIRIKQLEEKQEKQEEKQEKEAKQKKLEEKRTKQTLQPPQPAAAIQSPQATFMQTQQLTTQPQDLTTPEPTNIEAGYGQTEPPQPVSTTTQQTPGESKEPKKEELEEEPYDSDIKEDEDTEEKESAEWEEKTEEEKSEKKDEAKTQKAAKATIAKEAPVTSIKKELIDKKQEKKITEEVVADKTPITETVESEKATTQANPKIEQ